MTLIELNFNLFCLQKAIFVYKSKLEDILPTSSFIEQTFGDNEPILFWSALVQQLSLEIHNLWLIIKK